MIAEISRMFDLGGWLMYAIAGCSLVAWYLFLYNWQKIRTEKKALAVLQGKSKKSVKDAIFSDEINRFLKLKNNGASETEALTDFKANLETKLPRLEERIQVASAFIQVTPLLGLLGTVYGMILTFEHQALATQNNEMLAKGISQALYTTEYALLLAVPGVYISNLCQRSIQRVREHYQAFIRTKIHEVKA